MRNKLRIKLDAAARVIDFYRRHPDDAAAVQAARERLQALLARVSAMILSQQASQDEMRVAMAEREGAAEEMAGHITHLARLTAAIVKHQSPKKKAIEAGFEPELRSPGKTSKK